MKKKPFMYIAVTVIAFCVAFSGLPLAGGGLDVYAASKKPAQVKSLSATASKKTVKLKWKKAKGAKKYQVYYSLKKKTGFKRAATIKKTVFTVKSLKPGKRYYFKVRAINGKKKGKFSKTKSVRIPKASKKDITEGNNNTQTDPRQSGEPDSSAKNPDDSAVDGGNQSDPEQSSGNEHRTEDPAGTDQSGENDFKLLPLTVWIRVGEEEYTNENFTANVNSRINVSTNDPIKSIDLSNEKVACISSDQIEQIRSDSCFSFTLGITDIGKCSMTITDIYGRSVSVDFTITCSAWDGVVKSEEDPSLPVPDIDMETISGHEGYAGINVFWPEEFEEDGTCGFVALISNNPDFDYNNKFGVTDTKWNGKPYSKLSWYYVYGDQYIKVRTYRISGDTVYYGPWSQTVLAEQFDTKTEKTGEAQYKYELYYLNDWDTYSDSRHVAYLKTDNPNASTFGIIAGDRDIVANDSLLNAYADIDFKLITDYDNEWRKVDGGYLGIIEIEEAGQYTAEIREYHKDGYIVAAEYPITVLDYETEAYKYIDKVISDNTDETMNSLEKMRAVCAYLENGEYRYVTGHNNQLVYLASEPNHPWFLTKRWDSATSPAMLRVFAERIGGFENIRGGNDWESHAYAFVTFEGEEYGFCVCPSTDTAEVDYTMFDFNDKSKLYPVR